MARPGSQELNGPPTTLRWLTGFYQGAQLGTRSRQQLRGGGQIDAAGASVAGDQRTCANDAAGRDRHTRPHRGVGADDAVGLDGRIPQDHAMRPEKTVILMVERAGIVPTGTAAT